MGYCGPVDLGELVVKIAVKLLGKFGICSFPCSLFGATGLDDLTQLSAACLLESLDILEYDPWILGSGPKILHCGGIVGTGCAERLAVGRALTLET